MSDTPRTDQNASAMEGIWGCKDVVRGDFARQLERELAEAKAIIAEYPEGAIETLRKWWLMKKHADFLTSALAAEREQHNLTHSAFVAEIAMLKSLNDDAILTKQLERELSAAISLLAGWCNAVKNKGASWDDWDEWYKDACYRPGPLRELIDAKMNQLTTEESTQ